MRLINKYSLEDIILNDYGPDATVRVQDIINAIEKEPVEGLPATERQDVLKRAIKTYGNRAQLDMVIEEMSELTKAILKDRRAGGSSSTRAGVIEEAADVIIMLQQLCAIYGAAREIESVIDEKVERMEKRLACGDKRAQGACSQDVLMPAT